MQIEQRHWTPTSGWEGTSDLGAEAGLVLVFGGTDVLAQRQHFDVVRASYPKATIIGCSTAGEILGTRVFDDTLAVTAVRFERTQIRTAYGMAVEGESSHSRGKLLGAELPKEGLRHVFVLSDGIHVNGSDLVRGIREELPTEVQVTGGLSGDGARFKTTLVLDPSGAQQRRIVAVGFYGEALKVGFGSLGGWDAFGPSRVITRAEANVLFELDGQPALTLYKSYLGEHAKALPGSGLLFPLSLKTGSSSTTEVVRTVLGVDEDRKSMTFAGDMPVGAHARLMKANFDRLIEGAHGAALASVSSGGPAPQLAVLISCVGRKMVLKQRTEEELEAVREIVGDAAISGFYSYGEICPSMPDASCELHNQTMTITTFSEQ